MQDTKIPVLIDPTRAAKQKLSFKGVILSKHMKRLLESSHGTCLDVQTEFKFDVDVQGIHYLQGTAKTELDLLCQRCMKAYRQELHADFCCTPDEDTQDIKAIPEAYDMIVTDENGSMHLHQFIEDELILAMPLIPSHSDDICHSGNHDVTIGDIPNVEEERKNPFADLASLKKSN